MNQCYIPCIHYYEIHNKNNKPSVKVLCVIKDTEIKNLNPEEINNCRHFKTYMKNNPYKHLTEYKNNSNINHKKG